jgi:hypothetical protein
MKGYGRNGKSRSEFQGNRYLSPESLSFHSAFYSDLHASELTTGRPHPPICHDVFHTTLAESPSFGVDIVYLVASKRECASARCGEEVECLRIVCFKDKVRMRVCPTRILCRRCKRKLGIRQCQSV